MLVLKLLYHTADGGYRPRTLNRHPVAAMQSHLLLMRPLMIDTTAATLITCCTYTQGRLPMIITVCLPSLLAVMAPDASSLNTLRGPLVDDIYLMLPVLHKYNFAALMAICDAQLRWPGQAASPLSTSPLALSSSGCA